MAWSFVVRRLTLLSFCGLICVAWGSSFLHPLQWARWTGRFADEHRCLPEADLKTPPPAVTPELKELLSKAAKHNIVVYSLFYDTEDPEHLRNFDFETSVGSWLRRMACLDIKLVVVVDKKKWIKPFEKLGALPYWSRSFNKEVRRAAGVHEIDINSARYTLAESITAAGFHAFFVDLDVIWFQDPRELLADVKDFDLGAQDNGMNPAHLEAAPMDFIRQEATIHGEHLCCQGGMSGLCLGVTLVRATPGSTNISAQIRKRYIGGPCENQQAAIWAWFQACEPIGTVRCRAFSSSVVMNAGMFEPIMEAARAPDGSKCGQVGQPCSFDFLRNGPSMIHMDDRDDKIGFTRKVDLMWPPCSQQIGERDDHEIRTHRSDL